MQTAGKKRNSRQQPWRQWQRLSEDPHRRSCSAVSPDVFMHAPVMEACHWAHMSVCTTTMHYQTVINSVRHAGCTRRDSTMMDDQHGTRLRWKPACCHQGRGFRHPFWIKVRDLWTAVCLTQPKWDRKDTNRPWNICSDSARVRCMLCEWLLLSLPATLTAHEKVKSTRVIWWVMGDLMGDGACSCSPQSASAWNMTIWQHSNWERTTRLEDARVAKCA